jgi:hypothetical protein
MNVDHYFTIGSSHLSQGRPCEDYALSGALFQGQAVFGVVADGCSGVYANTDVGARAMAWAFKSCVEADARAFDGALRDDFRQRLQARFHQYQYTGEPDDYYATAVGFIATPDRATVWVHGDGAMVLRYADGMHELRTFTWANSTPFYLNYHTQAQLLNEFFLAHPATAPNPFVVKSVRFSVDGGTPVVLSTEEQSYSTAETLQGMTFELSPRVDKIVSISVLTDGVEQVGALSALDAVSPMVAFKNFQGEFVTRRMLKALKELAKVDAVPRDDVGIATVWFPQE